MQQPGHRLLRAIARFLNRSVGFNAFLFLSRGFVVLLMCTLLAIVFSASAVNAADQDPYQEEKQEVSKNIRKFRINIGRLQEGIQEQQEQVRQTRKVELTLLTELQDIDTRLVEQNHKITTLAARTRRQQELVAEKTSEKQQAVSLMQKLQVHVKKRMQAFYKLGNLGLINITFSNRTLPELLRFQDSFLALIKYDQRVIDTYRSTIAELDQAVESLKLQETIFEELILENREELKKLDAIKLEKEQLLARIRTQAKLHEQAAVEMETASQNLTSSLQNLEKKEQQLEQSFLYSKGSHPPPVSGTVITRFNQQTTNLLGISYVSKGIAIDAPSGSPVRAIHKGEVEYSGYLRGYGNTVIVNHGYRYYSITSRLERLLVKKGQQVDEHTDIGITGDTATLMTPGLYFELRQDTTNLDPLAWLDTSRLRL